MPYPRNAKKAYQVGGGGASPGLTDEPGGEQWCRTAPCRRQSDPLPCTLCLSLFSAQRVTWYLSPPPSPQQFSCKSFGPEHLLHWACSGCCLMTFAKGPIRGIKACQCSHHTEAELTQRKLYRESLKRCKAVSYLRLPLCAQKRNLTAHHWGAARPPFKIVLWSPSHPPTFLQSQELMKLPVIQGKGNVKILLT